MKIEYGLEHVSRAADAREGSEDDEAETLYTEEEINAMNKAQISHSKTKRALIPLIIGSLAVLLLVGLIIGIASLKNPGVALKGYSVASNDVSPAWSPQAIYNFSGSAQYVVRQLVRAHMESVVLFPFFSLFQQFWPPHKYYHYHLRPFVQLFDSDTSEGWRHLRLSKPQFVSLDFRPSHL